MSHATLPSAKHKSTPRISIIGAGISGLALACHLQSRKIPFNIYEARNAQTIGHGYAVTLQSSAVKTLKTKFSKKHLVELRQKTAVDRAIGGNGTVADQSKKGSATFQAVDRDFRRWLVNFLVGQGGCVNWNHKLTAVRTAADGSGTELHFENPDPTIADIVIDAGGLRSRAFECGIETAPRAHLLPYATYHGVRRMSSQEFLEKYAHYFGVGNTIELSADEDSTKPPTPFISLQKVHRGERGQKEHEVELRWIYSRPSKEGHDPLYRPARTSEEAEVIPPELYGEILTSIQLFSPKKRSMLQQFFSLNDLHEDRILNWHLRVHRPERKDVAANVHRKVYKVFVIGDAAHGLPIVKSNGAGLALKDARRMAEYIAALSKNRWEELPALTKAIPPPFRRGAWLEEAEDAVQRLRTAHGQRAHTPDELLGIVGFGHQGTDAFDEASKASDKVEPGRSAEKGKL